ncbi:MAG: ABC transporter permease subunit [Actinobacteria bacterium]|nr:MAG: ABC transporter permease subunit [Actinomycetota bacterium]
MPEEARDACRDQRGHNARLEFVRQRQGVRSPCRLRPEMGQLLAFEQIRPRGGGDAHRPSTLRTAPSLSSVAARCDPGPSGQVSRQAGHLGGSATHRRDDGPVRAVLRRAGRGPLGFGLVRGRTRRGEGRPLPGDGLGSVGVRSVSRASRARGVRPLDAHASGRLVPDLPCLAVDGVARVRRAAPLAADRDRGRGLVGDEAALRASLLPLVAILSMDAGIAFGATMFVERVFHIPGLGSLLVFSVSRPDLPVILGVMLMVAIFVLLLSLFLDLLCGLVDPRINVLPAPRARRQSPVQREPVGKPVPQTR